MSNIGNVSLPGHLDIGTTYTNSRIRCNAEVGGYTSYAEINAAGSYGMFINLSTTRTDGGWMYFKFNNDSCMQLSGSDNQVNIYKDTTTSTLTINGDLGSSMKFPLDIKNSTIHTEFWALASFHQGIANSGSWLQFSRDGTSNTWQAGMSSDNSYVIRASDATNMLIVNQKGNTTISGNLDFSKVLTLQRNPAVSDTPPLTITNSSSNVWFLGQFESPVNNIGCLIEYKTIASSTSWWTGVWGSNTNEFNIWLNYKGLSLKPTGDAVINGNLDIGPSQAQSSMKTYVNHVGSTGYMMMEGRYRDQGVLHVETNYQYIEMLTVRNTHFFIRCSDYAGNPYVQTFPPLTQSPDDKVNENEESIKEMLVKHYPN